MSVCICKARVSCALFVQAADYTAIMLAGRFRVAPMCEGVQESCPPRTYRSLNDFDHRTTLSTYPAEHLRVGAWRRVDWLGRRLSSALRTHPGS